MHTNRQIRWKALSLYCGILAIYLLTASGRIGHPDGDAKWRVSWSLLTEHSLNADPCEPTYAHCIEGIDGQHYAAHGILPSILLIPANAAGRLLARQTGNDQYVFARTLSSLCGSFIGAACAVVLALWIHALGFSRRTACGPAIVLAFASSLWSHSVKALWAEPYFTLALVGAAYLLTTAKTSRGLAAAGAVLGLACLCRINGVAFIPAFLLYHYLLRRNLSFPARLSNATVIVLGWAVVFSGALLANYVRFGSLFSTGYVAGRNLSSVGRIVVNQLQSPAATDVLSSMMLSGEQGFITFTPWLLLIAVFARSIYKACSRQMILAMTMFVLNVVVFLPVPFLGNASFGPRYFVPLLPFFAILLTPLFTRHFWINRSGVARHLTLATLLLSVAIHLIVVPYPPGRYFLVKAYNTSAGENPWWMGYPTLEALSALPQLISEVPAWRNSPVVANTLESGAPITGRGDTRVYSSSREHLLSTPNPMTVLTPDLWLLRAFLIGIPPIVPLVIAMVLLAIAALALREVFKEPAGDRPPADARGWKPA